MTVKGEQTKAHGPLRSGRGVLFTGRARHGSFARASWIPAPGDGAVGALCGR
ncbi:hypothetical protein ACIQ9E_08610 [Streptomyces sp. NPDC094448]|uniref:hypothetical protein n=1 Tax=Streptomyces sp. NPDC094448 TaxID=3366063 RepID=UPI0038232808